MATNTVATKQTHTAANNASGNTSGPYTISFDYLSESDVEVRVDNTLKTQTTHYTFPSKTSIQFTSGNFPALGATIEIKRNTDITVPKVDFQDGSVLTESDLDNNSKHLLFGMQETKEDVEGLVSTFVGASAPTGASVVNGARWYDTVSGRTFIYYVDTDTAQWVEASPPFDATEFTSNITNTNVATNAAIDSTKLSFTQTGIGTVARTVDSKLEERISVKDFGAVGDGTTDDLAAFTAATAYINDLTDESVRELYIPSGKYHLSDIWKVPTNGAYDQTHIIGHGAVLDNTVVVNGSGSCLHGIQVHNSPDAGFVFLRGQLGYHENLLAKGCYYGYYFGVASRQTLTVASTSGFAVGDKVTADPNNGSTSQAFGHIIKIDAANNKLFLVKCNAATQAGFFRERLATFVQSNGSGGAGNIATITYDSHGLSNGNSVLLNWRSGEANDDATNGTYTVANVTTNTFTVTRTGSAALITDASFVRIIQNETIKGDGAGGGTTNQTTTVSAVTSEYGANSQVTRVHFNGCGANDIGNAGFYIDGTTTGQNRSWFNANVTNNLALVDCDGKAFKVRPYEGGNAGGSQANYNTHIGMNIESGATNESIFDSVGRQNTFIGGHFVKTNGSGVSVSITQPFNYVFGGRYLGTINISGNAQFYHRATGGSYAEINGIQKLTTSSGCNFESQGTTFIKESFSPLPSTYITKNLGSSNTTNHELIIDLSGHSSFTAGNGTDVHSSLINNPHIFRVNIFGVRSNSGFANRIVVLPCVIVASQENNDFDGYDADIVIAGTPIRISGTPTVAVSNTSSFTSTGGASINKAGVIVLTFTTTEEIGSWDAMVEYHTLNGTVNYSTP